MPVIKAFYSPGQNIGFWRSISKMLFASRNTRPADSDHRPALTAKDFIQNKN
jgi:hypothetical protein